MFQDIFDVGKEIFELSPQLYQRRKDERLKIANLLQLIGFLLEDAVEKLRNGHHPTSKGHQLERLSEELYFRLAFTLGEIKARSLARKLNNVFDFELLQRSLSQSTYHHLTLLEHASYYFLESSTRLRMVIMDDNDMDGNSKINIQPD